MVAIPFGMVDAELRFPGDVIKSHGTSRKRMMRKPLKKVMKKNAEKCKIQPQ
jgi:hypothetical protein